MENPNNPKKDEACPFCGGDGWVPVDVGQVFECIPCGGTGKKVGNP